VFLYDSGNASAGQIFLGGVSARATDTNVELGIFSEPETELPEILGARQYHSLLNVASTKLTVVVVSDGTPYYSNTVLIIVGGVLILSCSAALAAGVCLYVRRRRFVAEAEKAAIRVENAKSAAMAERQLNVRNSMRRFRERTADYEPCIDLLAGLLGVANSRRGTKERLDMIMMIVKANMMYIDVHVPGCNL